MQQERFQLNTDPITAIFKESADTILVLNVFSLMDMDVFLLSYLNIMQVEAYLEHFLNV